MCEIVSRSMWAGLTRARSCAGAPVTSSAPPPEGALARGYRAVLSMGHRGSSIDPWSDRSSLRAANDHRHLRELAEHLAAAADRPPLVEKDLSGRHIATQPTISRPSAAISDMVPWLAASTS